MAKRTIAVEILKLTFVSGELAKPGDVFSVSETDAHFLISTKKAKICTPAAAKAAEQARANAEAEAEAEAEAKAAKAAAKAAKAAAKAAK